VFAAHANINGAAIDTLIGAMTMNMLSGGGLQTSVSVRGRPAIDTMPFIIIMHMEPIQALLAAGAIGGGTAKLAFCGHLFSPSIPLISAVLAAGSTRQKTKTQT
jgi:hypothetical protein